MKTPHKHAELIKAWADGAQIEARQGDSNTWVAVQEPNWSIHGVYRIQPKPDVVQNILINVCGQITYLGHFADKTNLKLTFDGETGLLKAAEVIA
jgi:hypothetical protein